MRSLDWVLMVDVICSIAVFISMLNILTSLDDRGAYWDVYQKKNDEGRTGAGDTEHDRNHEILGRKVDPETDGKDCDDKKDETRRCVAGNSLLDKIHYPGDQERAEGDDCSHDLVLGR